MSAIKRSRLLESLGARLTTPLLPGAYAELFNPLWGEGLRAKVESILPEGDKAVSLVLRPNHRWSGAMAGQYIRLGVDIGGVRHARNYSLTSSSSTLENLVTLTVQRLEGGLVSNYINDDLRIGDMVFLSEPAGEFTLAGSAEKLLFITAGSGLTPAMGLQRTLAENGAPVAVAHWHFARTAGSSLFADERRVLAAAMQWDLKESYTGEGASHFATAELDAFCPDWRTRKVYACGPRALVDAVQAAHRAEGQGELVVEFFAPPVFEVGGEESPVKFVSSGKQTMASAGRNLLEVAEETGLCPPHGCRMGICHGCLTTLESGQVRDHASGEVINTPGESIRLCVCSAESAVSLKL